MKNSGLPSNRNIISTTVKMKANTPSIHRGLKVTQPRDSLLEIYTQYEAACQRAGVVDFAELLLRSLELLRDNAEILIHYQNRFKHILVDEFQDTNTLQYNWIKLLAGENIPPFVVGDDDQSIYGWRGAKIEHIQNFSRDFSGDRNHKTRTKLPLQQAIFSTLLMP